MLKHRHFTICIFDSILSSYVHIKHEGRPAPAITITLETAGERWCPGLREDWETFARQSAKDGSWFGFVRFLGMVRLLTMLTIALLAVLQALAGWICYNSSECFKSTWRIIPGSGCVVEWLSINVCLSGSDRRKKVADPNFRSLPTGCAHLTWFMCC